jgi:pimeloyl-ACP methyl ester carboxylesterase
MNSCKSQQERTTLLSKCLAASKLASTAENGREFEVYREWLLRWFLREDPPTSAVKLQDLRKGNVEEWLAWAFFDASLDEIQSKTVLSDLLSLTNMVEGALHVKFAAGHNRQIRCIRLTLDKMHATQRPLVYYWAINLLLGLGKIGIHLLGYRKRIVHGGSVYYRPAVQVPAAPPAKGAKPAKPAKGAKGAKGAKPTTPIVFCHGLGVGYVHYLWVLKALPPSSPVYLLDFPNITMTLGAETQPSVASTQQLVKRTLADDGHTSACFVAHSFGTICVSWLLNSQDASICSLVKSTVLIDPISLMLFDPAVAFNFVHRSPCNAVQVMMSYFVSQEMYIAHTLARMFSWSHAALFLGDVPEDVRVEVLLSGDDAIVPAKLVRAYVNHHHQRASNQRASKGVKGNTGGAKTSRECVWFDKVHHGQLMLHESHIMAISESVSACVADGV